MSNYERGVTILDLSDPLAPSEIGHFDTFPSSNNASFNGVWGVYPYLPSGIILASDIQGGLYILKDETNSAAKDDLHFSASSYEVSEGNTLNVSVIRSGTKAISVDYQIIRGATSGNDFVAMESGTLLWEAGDSIPKTISIEAIDDNNGEGTESMFIRLENASENAELGLPNIAKIDIQSLTGRSSSIILSDDSLTVKETDTAIELTVTRSGASDLAATVGLRIESDSAEAGSDVTLSNSQLEWAVGELGAKSFSISIINDDISEELETFSLVLENPENVDISGSSRLEVSIRDDDSNQAPEVNTETSLNVNTRQSILLTATANDPEQQEMRYLWTQTAGPNVNLSDADSLTTRFTSPETASTLSFSFTATDDFGATTSINVSVNVAAPDIAPAPVVEPTPPASSSSGGAIGLINLLILLSLCRRRVKNKVSS
jgi:hypothetical protein